MRPDARRYRAIRLGSEAVKVLAVGQSSPWRWPPAAFPPRSSALADDEPEVTGVDRPESARYRFRRHSTRRIGGAPRRPWAWPSIRRGRERSCRGTIPRPRMKGQFTPTGAPYVKNDEICRDFSAHLSGPASASLQGSACRPSGGDWAHQGRQTGKADRPKPDGLPHSPGAADVARKQHFSHMDVWAEGA